MDILIIFRARMSTQPKMGHFHFGAIFTLIKATGHITEVSIRFYVVVVGFFFENVEKMANVIQMPNWFDVIGSIAMQ